MIQDRLNTVANAGLLVDGEFAPLTSRAITAFQRSRGLVADGEVGSITWAELFFDRSSMLHEIDGHGRRDVNRHQTPIVIRVLPILARGRATVPASRGPPMPATNRSRR